MTPEFGSPASALITGGAKRIGAALTRALVADGWHVHIHCNESVAEAEALVAEIASTGGRASIVRADLADSDSCRTLFDRLAPGNPPVSLLINNASLFRYDTQTDFSTVQWDEQIDVNLRAPALLTQQFAARCAGRNGLVINLLDAKVFAPNPDFYSYTVSKLGLAGLTDLQARALAPNIRVNGIAPSVTLVSGPQTRENFERAHVYNPLRRGVLVEHVVMTMQYLIALPTITGQVIALDAGQRLLGMPRDVAFMVGEGV